MTIGHNSGISARDLVAFAERIERLSEEIGGLQEERKEVYEEAKAAGFDAPTLRRAIKLREMPKKDREEAAAMLDLYVAVLDDADRAATERSIEEGV